MVGVYNIILSIVNHRTLNKKIVGDLSIIFIVHDLSRIVAIERYRQMTPRLLCRNTSAFESAFSISYDDECLGIYAFWFNVRF